MITVALLTTSFQKSGPNNVILNLAIQLKKIEVEPIVVSLGNENSSNNIKQDLLNNSIRFVESNLSLLKSILKGKRFLNNLIKEFNIDIINSHTIRANIISSFTKVPNVITIHSELSHFNPHKFGELFTKVIALIYRRFLFRQPRLISCSNSLRNELNKVGIKTTSIQNGIDIDKYHYHSKIYDNNDLKFLCIGDFIPRKNFITIIEAFKTCSDLKLLVVGSGILEKEFSRKINGYNNINIYPRTDSPQFYYRNCDIFISASIAEGLPLAVLEAMSIGMPTILSKISPHIEILEDSNNKFLFDCKDVNGLKDLIVLFRNMDLTEVSKESSNVIQNNFTSAIMARKYKQYFQNTIKNVRN